MSTLRSFSIGGAVAAAVIALGGCSRASDARPVEATSALRAEPRAAPSALAQPPEMPSKKPGFAVVELFTSEGCSSCPPADAALARIAERAQADGARVFPLELHVDYWDYLGWRDPFDDARFSQRQGGYRALNGSTYTPQAVVNGAAETVGSNARALGALIESALATPATTTLSLSASWQGDGVLVRYRSDGAEPAQVLHLFLVERESESRVTRGENAGEALTHHNLARAFATRPLAPGHAQGSWQIQLPQGFSRAGARVLGFAQREPQAAITGASAVPVKNAPDATDATGATDVPE